MSGEAEKRGGLREQALIRREDLSSTREEERRRSSTRKEEGVMMVRRESSPRREGGGRRESSPRKEDPVGRRENSSRHSSLVSRTSQVLPKEYSQIHTIIDGIITYIIKRKGKKEIGCLEWSKISEKSGTKFLRGRSFLVPNLLDSNLTQRIF